jgi:hypothetical protein
MRPRRYGGPYPGSPAATFALDFEHIGLGKLGQRLGLLEPKRCVRRATRRRASRSPVAILRGRIEISAQDGSRQVSLANGVARLPVGIDVAFPVVQIWRRLPKVCHPANARARTALLSAEQLEPALQAVADFADLKLPFTLSHCPPGTRPQSLHRSRRRQPRPRRPLPDRPRPSVTVAVWQVLGHLHRALGFHPSIRRNSAMALPAMCAAHTPEVRPMVIGVLRSTRQCAHRVLRPREPCRRSPGRGQERRRQDPQARGEAAMGQN